MHRIGIISDTHGFLREEVKNILRTCDTILHGGDIDSLNLLAELTAIAPTIAVQGNNDRNWADPLPLKRIFTLYGLHFFMIHDKKQLPGDLGDSDIIIYGHSHRYEELQKDGRLWLNPGSCGAKRFRLPLTMALLEVDSHSHYQVTRVDLSGETQPQIPEPASLPPFSASSGNLPLSSAPAALDRFARTFTPEALASLSQRDLRKLVQDVIKETDKGIPVERIAARHGLPLELAQQICRLYLTHPGINAEGILRKGFL